MTDMRRTFLWGVFLVSLIMLYDGWNRHTGQPSLFAPPPAAKTPAPSQPAQAAATGTTAPVAAPGAQAAVPAEKITVTTDMVKATIDSRGGALVRLELLKQQEHVAQPWYHAFLALVGAADKAPPASNVVLLDESAQRHYVAQTSLLGPAGAALPNQHTVMRVVTPERSLADGAPELRVTLESPEAGGVVLRKTYRFQRGSYLIGVTHEVVNVSGAPVEPQLALQLVRDGSKPPGESSFYFTFTGPAVYNDATKFRKVDFKDIAAGDKPEYQVQADNGWVAMVQHYFASAWLVDPAQGPALPREYFTTKVDANYAVGMRLPLGPIAPGATKSLDALLFAGPQEEKKLEALAEASPIRAQGLELVKDYGWFTILSKPLYWLLEKLHTLFGNWGWAIVALVVSLRIAFYWLNVSAYRSMAKMKAVGPRITEMRERLKDKPQQMQQEMMRIYREEKINPLGGCLPIFVQMPFFIALYWVLLSSVEMRNAPWIGWIHDLSAPDPYFILPLLMTASSLLQVALNPTPPDPMQAKMMWIMPLAFSVMFFFFPAGLVLYWLTNNILAISQQYLINKQLGVLKK